MRGVFKAVLEEKCKTFGFITILGFLSRTGEWGLGKRWTLFVHTSHSHPDFAGL